MARPKEQGEQRRNLVQAAMDAIAARGLSGLRLKDIADHAGLSIGSVSYYYPEIDDLLIEAHKEAMDRFYFHRVELVNEKSEAREQIVIAISNGIPAEPVTSDITMLYELHTHSSRSAKHSALMSTLWEREVSLYERIISHGVVTGEFSTQQPVREISETAVALEDAFNLHLVSGNVAISATMGRERVINYLESSLACSLREQLIKN